jgi:hypothetical protein
LLIPVVLMWRLEKLLNVILRIFSDWFGSSFLTSPYTVSQVDFLACVTIVYVVDEIRKRLIKSELQIWLLGF